MENFIQFRLTNTGKAAMLSANDGSVGFSVAQIRFSRDALNINNLEHTTAINNVVMTKDIAPGSSIQNGNILQIALQVVSGSPLDIRSIGIYTENGVLIAVASAHSGLIFSLYPGIPLVMIAVIILLDESVQSYTARIDANASIMSIFLQNHINASHPHSIYLPDVILQSFKALVDEIIDEFLHVGVWIGTDNINFNPSALIYSLLGVRTIWRLRPYAPLGQPNTQSPINQLAPISGGGSTYQTNSTLIWVRMPDDYRDPYMTLSASAVQVNEGDSVTFTLSTSNITPGTQFSYRITGIDQDDIQQPLTGIMTVGADNKAQVVITVLNDQKTEGLEVLRFEVLNEQNLFIDVNIQDTSLTPVYYVNSDFVNITNPSRSNPQFEFLPVLEEYVTWTGVDTKYQAASNTVLGYVMNAHYKGTYFDNPDYWFRIGVDIGNRGATAQYQTFDRVNKSNPNHFIPLPDGGLLVNLSQIFIDYGYSSNGLLRYGEDNTVDVFFGYCHDDYYDSGTNAVISLPFGHGRMAL